jgi:hypothetical protein
MFGITDAVAAKLAEEEHFQSHLKGMSDEQKLATLKIRDDIQAEKRYQRELVEAAKPHTLWSFLGLAKK